MDGRQTKMNRTRHTMMAEAFDGSNVFWPFWNRISKESMISAVPRRRQRFTLLGRFFFFFLHGGKGRDAKYIPWFGEGFLARNTNDLHVLPPRFLPYYCVFAVMFLLHGSSHMNRSCRYLVGG